MREVGFRAVPELVGRSRDCACWAAILEINDRIREIHPEPFVELCLCNDRPDPFHNGSICTFCNAVLVWAVRSCCFVNNARSLEVKSHPFFVLPSSICS